MSRQTTKSNDPNLSVCQDCGSRKLQSIELAYRSSVRIGEGGYLTRSLFSADIEPPERRSTIREPLFSLISVASASLLIIPALINDGSTELRSAIGMFHAQVYVPSVIIGLIAFSIHFARVTNYNARGWAKEYVQWQRQKVCRDCGSVWSAPEAGL